MASIIYDSFLDDVARGNIDLDTDSFKCMLVSAAYTEDRVAHTKRSNISNEIVGAGYTAGGASVAVTVTKDTVNHRIDISLGAVSLSSASITARKAIYYKSRGGASNLDELIACIDFGSDVTSTNDTWSLSASTIRQQL